MSKEQLIFDAKGETGPFIDIVRDAAKRTAVKLDMDYVEKPLPENFGLTETFLPEDFE